MFVALVCVPGIAPAAILFSDDFETHTHNDLLNSISPPVGTYANTGASAEVQDSTVPGAPITSAASGIKYAYMAATGGAADIGATFNAAATTGQVVTVSFSMYLNSATSYSVLEVVGFNPTISSGRSFDTMYYTDGSAKLYDATQSPATVNALNANSFPRDEWVPVSIEANYGAGTYSVQVGSTGWNWTMTPNAVGQIYFYNGGYQAAIDNLLVYTGEIPEPASAALIGLTGGGLLLGRRRNH